MNRQTEDAVTGGVSQGSAQAAADFERLKTKHGLLTNVDIHNRCALRGPMLVGNLLPRQSVGLIVGDSGLGKSPLMYQLGLCVAAGVPFLGFPVCQGRVVVMDYENGLDDIKLMTERLSTHLGLAGFPEQNFLISSFGESEPPNITELCGDLRPALMIIDSLRAYDPQIAKEDKAVQHLMWFKQNARYFDAAFLGIHHIKKPTGDWVPDLNDPDSSVQNWLLLASGTRALINQSDVRIGVDKLFSKGAEGLILRGFMRVRGEIGPIYIGRTLDPQSREPLGYYRLVGVELLFNDEQGQAFQKLPDRFEFKQAHHAYGKGDQATTDFLKKCIRIGILQQPKSRGPYEKVRVAE